MCGWEGSKEFFFSFEKIQKMVLIFYFLQHSFIVHLDLRLPYVVLLCLTFSTLDLTST